MSTDKITITHNVYDLPTGFLHSITVDVNGNVVTGMKVGYKEIARCSSYAATTEYYQGILPSVFKLTASGFIKEARVFDKTPDLRFPHKVKES